MRRVLSVPMRTLFDPAKPMAPAKGGPRRRSRSRAFPSAPIAVLVRGVGLALLLQAAPALALDCADTITQATAECVTATGLANARACRAAAEARGCPGQFAPASLDMTGTCARNNRINVDWVFDDAGANARYRRLLADGRSRFEAVMAAQGHNPPVQRSFLQCRAWVEAYLASRDSASSAADPVLGTEDCRCISAVPTGNGGIDGQGREYRVSNSCAALDVAVQFVDAANSTRTTWARLGELAGGGSRTVFAPGYDIPSIRAIEVRRGSAFRTCAFR